MRQCNPYILGASNLIDGFIASYESSSNLSSYTFSACDIGTANAARVVVVGVIVLDSGSDNGISSVTIGGAAATKATSTTTAGDLANARVAGIYYKVVAAGTTADIVVASSNAAETCGISVYAIYPASSTPVDTSNDSAGSAGSMTSTLTVEAGGMCISVHTHNNANNTIWSWSGTETISQDFDEACGDSGNLWSGAHFVADANGTHTVTADYTGTPNCSIATASWGA